MEVRTKATDYEMTPDVSAYLDERLAHLERILGADNDVAQCDVEIGRDAGRPRHGANIYFAEITVRVPGGVHARATNRSESLNGAIDAVKGEIERQLRQGRKVHRRVLRKSGALAKWLLRME